MDSEGLRELAAEQSGLFTRKQAAECGFSQYQIRKRIFNGEWVAVVGATLVGADVEHTAGLRDRAAHLTVPGSVVAGASAARWWGLDVPGIEPMLIVPPHRHPRVMGVRILRTELLDLDVLARDGLRLTSKARTVVDCLRLLPERVAWEVLDHALRLGWISIEELTARVGRMVGRRGSRQAVKLSRAAGSGARSELDRRAVALLRRAGIAGWQRHLPIHDDSGLIGVGDLVFPADRVVVELDQAVLDPDRLAGAGWVVLRFSWRELAEHPDEVVRRVGALVHPSGVEAH